VANKRVPFAQTLMTLQPHSQGGAISVNFRLSFVQSILGQNSDYYCVYSGHLFCAWWYYNVTFAFAYSKRISHTEKTVNNCQ